MLSLVGQKERTGTFCVVAHAFYCVILLIGSNHREQDCRVTFIPTTILVGCRDRRALVSCEWCIVRLIGLWHSYCPLQAAPGLPGVMVITIAVNTITKKSVLTSNAITMEMTKGYIRKKQGDH